MLKLLIVGLSMLAALPAIAQEAATGNDTPAAEAAGDKAERLGSVVDTLVRLVLAQRQAARERKDYATADALRDELQGAGLVIEDTPSGPRWELG